MTEAVVKYQPNAQVGTTRHLKALMDIWGPSIAGVLPSQVKPERMLKVLLVAVNKNPTLLSCTQESLFQAMMELGQTGLELGVLQEAHLIPYRNKGVMQAQLQIDYKGYVRLMRQAGALAVDADAVYEKDHWEFEKGLEPKLRHVRAEGDRGKFKGAWALVKPAAGEVQFDYMTAAEINKIRARSKAKDSGPWVTDYDEMAKKTVLRRVRKLVPLAVSPPEEKVRIEDPRAVLGLAELVDNSQFEDLPAGDDDAAPIQQGADEKKSEALARELQRQKAEQEKEESSEAVQQDLEDDDGEPFDLSPFTKKMLEGMNQKGLRRVCQDAGISFEEDDSVAELRKLILAARGPDPKKPAPAATITESDDEPVAGGLTPAECQSIYEWVADNRPDEIDAHGAVLEFNRALKSMFNVEELEQVGEGDLVGLQWWLDRTFGAPWPR